MSWQAYVDNNLVGTGKITKAAIYGQDGTPWAISAGFSVSPQEVTALIGGFTDPSALRAGGLHISGVKYFTLRADDRSIYGKQGASGAICVKTKQAVLVALYAEPTQPGEATKTVEALADYLISVNYVRCIHLILS
ncbi:profilin [Zopfochytrium polystomum]|nr:profilin [Zopfochytrium polystomum]